MTLKTQVPRRSSQKSRNAKGEDRISNIPEGVITHILSLLPTKDAVRTCVLSKDWEYKWASIYNADIDDQLVLLARRNVKSAFDNFVERIILLPSHNIKSFRLSCREQYDLSCMMAWITAALRRNVECFELTYYHLGIILPPCFLNNSSLIKLKLELHCIFKIPTINCFPNLTSLDLYGVWILNEFPNTDTMILNFPLLETFDVLRCAWLNVKFVEIHAPALTTFWSGAPYEGEVEDYSIKILGARVADFKSYGGLPENIILDGSRIVTAALQNHENTYNHHLLRRCGLQLRTLLQGMSILEDLEISGWVVEAIAETEDLIPLPRSDKLRRLVLHSRTNIRAMLELLHAVPYLKFLVLDLGATDGFDYNALQNVPTCVMSHLEEVELINYAGATPHLHLAKFFLKNGLELRKCHLHIEYKVLTNKMVRELSNFPKASSCLAVTIS